MVIKVTLWQIFPEYFGFFANHHSTYCPILAYHLGAGTVGQFVAEVGNGLSLTPHHAIKKKHC
jgi:hypothetical protein